MDFLNNNEKKTTIVSFLLTSLVWYLMTGSLFVALGMLALLSVHEMGHYYAAVRKGVPVTLPVFTPLGAFIMTPGNRDAAEEAYVAFAGPLIGTLGALVAFALGVLFHSQLLLGIGHWGFLINLFNLIPLSPLDGGRISMAINRRLFFVGLPLLFLAFMQFGLNPINVVFFALIAMQGWKDYQQREEQLIYSPGYFDVGAAVRTKYTVAYVGLALFLSWVYFMPAGLLTLLVHFGL